MKSAPQANKFFGPRSGDALQGRFETEFVDYRRGYVHGMQMSRTCGECGRRSVGSAHFCPACGKPLDAGPNTAGRAIHPMPLPAPGSMEPVEGASSLYFAIESAFGGPRLIGTETLCVVLFNGGFALRSVVLQVAGHAPGGPIVFDLSRTVEILPRGGEVRVEVSSYEIPEPVEKIRVSLLHAEYA